jgi:hypothetical protein
VFPLIAVAEPNISPDAPSLAKSLASSKICAPAFDTQARATAKAPKPDNQECLLVCIRVTDCAPLAGIIRRAFRVAMNK